MTLSKARLARYTAIVGVALLWVLSVFGMLITADSLLGFFGVDVPLPALTRFAPVVAVVGIVGIGYGRYRSGSWSKFLATIGRTIEAQITDVDSSPPAVVGRLRHHEVAWRVKYWTDGRIEVVHRECPHCSVELSEKYLPARAVQDRNNAFSPGDTAKSSAGTWDDAFSEEQAEYHREQLALACSRCNFSIPGDKAVQEGEDDVRAMFRRHVEAIEQGPTGRGNVDAFADIDTSDLTDRVRARAIWDGYVDVTDDDTLLSFGTEALQSVEVA